MIMILEMHVLLLDLRKASFLQGDRQYGLVLQERDRLVPQGARQQDTWQVKGDGMSDGRYGVLGSVGTLGLSHGEREQAGALCTGPKIPLPQRVWCHIGWRLSCAILQAQ